MTGMIILSFALGYPVFMLLMFVLYKILFTPLDQVVEERKRERALLIARAKRTKKSRRKHSPVMEREPAPVFVIGELNTSHS